MSKALVLLSGGMDSVTALHWARREHEGPKDGLQHEHGAAGGADREVVLPGRDGAGSKGETAERPYTQLAIPL